MREPQDKDDETLRPVQGNRKLKEEMTMEKNIEELTFEIRKSFDHTMELLEELSKTSSRDKDIGEEARKINEKMKELLLHYNHYRVGYREGDLLVTTWLGHYKWMCYREDKKDYEFDFWLNGDFDFSKTLDSAEELNLDF